MNPPDASDDLNKLRELGPYETGNLFRIIPDIDRARITVANPIVGLLGTDRTGALYLAPEPDYQGHGMESIGLKGITLDSIAGRGLLGRVVKIAGTYDVSTGITVEEIAACEEDL